jgi:NAD-dependent SIR2 family protein deacetylase
MPDVCPPLDAIASAPLPELERLVRRASRLVVLTGAGCSTDSGIPDYRDDTGAWKRKPPVFYADFVGRDDTRRRYWARSLAGWPSFAGARPNRAHAALARLEALGRVHHLITQNVDGLHQRAGSVRVTDLHGRLDTVECLSCCAREDREAFQRRLLDANPSRAAATAPSAPDGDADLTDSDFASFAVPECRSCRGVMKPSVVFFGEAVPAARVAESYERVAEADLLLVAGTSLEIFSGRRFVTAAVDRGVRVAIVNRGVTRADDLAAIRIVAGVGEVLAELATRFGA